jgi:hypothetical protein
MNMRNLTILELTTCPQLRDVLITEVKIKRNKPVGDQREVLGMCFHLGNTGIKYQLHYKS